MYAKLYSSILNSSLWVEDAETRLLWVTLLALADREGFVFGSPIGIANTARISVAGAIAALDKFCSPDVYSGDLGVNPENEGRRLAIVPGGWRLLNYCRYRNIKDSEARREMEAAKKRRYREKQSLSTGTSTKVHPSESESESESESTPKKGTREGVAPAPARKGTPWNGRPGSVEEVKTYWSEKGLKGDPLQFYDHYDANGWMMGKAHIKSWSAAARNWSRNEATFGPPKPPPTGNPPKATGSTDAEFDFQNRKRWRMEADMKKRFELRGSGSPSEKIKNEMEKYQLELDKKYGTDTTEFTA